MVLEAELFKWVKGNS